MRRLLFFFAVLLVTASAVACNAILGLDELDPYEGPAPEGSDAAQVGSDANGDAAPNTGGEAGSIGEAGKSPCEPDATTPSSAVHVSADSDAGAGADGTVDAPFTTIGAGIAYARLTDAKQVVVAEGIYAERVELTNLPHGITIDGAWVRSGAAWRRDCADDRATKTVIASPEDVGVVVRGVTTKSSLTNLSVRTADAPPSAPDAPGRSRWGIWIEGSTVVLDNVRVVAGSGAAGGVARAGAAGTPLCTGFAPSCVTTPAAGSEGPPGAPATSAGMFSAAGFEPSNGHPGVGSGTPGSHGSTPGAPAQRDDCEDGCKPQTTCESSKPSGRTVVGEAGHCGCGGGGGGPGGGGWGGGASVALFAVGASTSVLVTNSELEARNGGAGSVGGTGGEGAAGTSGAPGASASCWGFGCCALGSCPDGPDCQCFHPSDPTWPQTCSIPRPTAETVAGGTAGSAGASGGRGSHGGAGAGGSAYAYVPLGAFVVLTDSRRAYGVGGVGPNGAVGGPTGEKP